MLWSELEHIFTKLSYLGELSINGGKKKRKTNSVLDTKEQDDGRSPKPAMIKMPDPIADFQ